jgi:type IV secretory pathway VirB2 component (pilin)
MEKIDMTKAVLWVVVALAWLLASGSVFAMPGADAVNEVKDSFLNDWGPPLAVIGILVVAVRKKFFNAGWGEVAAVLGAILLFFLSPALVEWLRGIAGG